MTLTNARPQADGDLATTIEIPGGIYRSNRRRFLTRCFAAGVGLSLGGLAKLPPARNAFASHVGRHPYEIKGLPCPTYASGHQCNPGCGPSRVHADACDVADPHYTGYHRRAGLGWKVRPNQCYGGWADGWRWSTPCVPCLRGATLRCHDGWRCNSSGGNCYPTICRWFMGCN